MEKENDKQIEEEMKEKNEEILKHWRNTGFLIGLKEGSQNEWRCAKSFDLMANYFLSKTENEINNHENTKDEVEKISILQALTFPIIRRLICRIRPRVNRIIQPEEIVIPFKNVTIREIFEVISEKNKKKNEYKWVYKLIKYYNLFDKQILTAISELQFFVDIKMLRNVFNVNIEAEIISLFSEYLAVKLNEKKNG